MNETKIRNGMNKLAAFVNGSVKLEQQQQPQQQQQATGAHSASDESTGSLSTISSPIPSPSDFDMALNSPLDLSVKAVASARRQGAKNMLHNNNHINVRQAAMSLNGKTKQHHQQNQQQRQSSNEKSHQRDDDEDVEGGGESIDEEDVDEPKNCYLAQNHPLAQMPLSGNGANNNLLFAAAAAMVDLLATNGSQTAANTTSNMFKIPNFPNLYLNYLNSLNENQTLGKDQKPAAPQQQPVQFTSTPAANNSISEILLKSMQHQQQFQPKQTAKTFNKQQKNAPVQAPINYAIDGSLLDSQMILKNIGNNHFNAKSNNSMQHHLPSPLLLQQANSISSSNNSSTNSSTIPSPSFTNGAGTDFNLNLLNYFKNAAALTGGTIDASAAKHEPAQHMSFLPGLNSTPTFVAPTVYHHHQHPEEDLGMKMTKKTSDVKPAGRLGKQVKQKKNTADVTPTTDVYTSYTENEHDTKAPNSKRSKIMPEGQLNSPATVAHSSSTNSLSSLINNNVNSPAAEVDQLVTSGTQKKRGRQSAAAKFKSPSLTGLNDSVSLANCDADSCSSDKQVLSDKELSALIETKNIRPEVDVRKINLYIFLIYLFSKAYLILLFRF